MLKIFVTGDNHIGIKYDRYPDIREKLIESRFDALKDMVDKANEEHCDLFVVTGDLFDSLTVKKSDIKKVVSILSGFSETTLVIPGNHDYYSGNEALWSTFTEETATVGAGNILLLNEYRPYDFGDREEPFTVYPAFCSSKHSAENKLGWIKQAEVDGNVINIGIAHGTIEGISPDNKREYFVMSTGELESIPMDVWFIGHTHVPFPADLSETEKKYGYRIFNAGTHVQTDLGNNTEGDAFIVEVERKDGKTQVGARKYISGNLRFYDLTLDVLSDRETSLRDGIAAKTADLSTDSVIRIRIAGSVKKEEYEDRKNIYASLLGLFLNYEIIDDELCEEITVDKIHEEFAQTSFASRFMEKLIGDPTQLQMVYHLVKKCEEA